eukprot:GFUD01025170.1.p1 GENE.GFUD01025170.1~~GFUD01025170.1.p1  ORF type:complete len:112 (-),score=29.34 GFUD01025170.1:62-397(-)
MERKLFEFELKRKNLDLERKDFELEMMKRRWVKKDKQEVIKNRTENSRDTTGILGRSVDEEPFATMSEHLNKVTKSVTTSDKNHNQVTSVYNGGSCLSSRAKLRTRSLKSS